MFITIVDVVVTVRDLGPEMGPVFRPVHNKISTPSTLYRIRHFCPWFTVGGRFSLLLSCLLRARQTQVLRPCGSSPDVFVATDLDPRSLLSGRSEHSPPGVSAETKEGTIHFRLELFRFV